MRHAFILVIGEVIIILHKEPEWVLTTYSIIRHLILIAISLEPLECAHVCADILEYFASSQVYLNGSGLSLAGDYALLSVEEVSKPLVFDVERGPLHHESYQWKQLPYL